MSTSNDGKTRLFGRRAVILGCVGVLIAGGCLCYWYVKKRRDEAHLSFMQWRGWAESVTADRARAEWARLEKEMGLANHLLERGERVSPYYVVASKYFAEGKYGQAFDVYAEAQERAECGPDNLQAYLAGLAGRRDWLRSRVAEVSDGLEAAFLRANLAWAENDDGQLLAVTDPESVRRLSDESREGAAGTRIWILFLRAKAFRRSGKNDLAYETLMEEVLPKFGQIAKDHPIRYLGVHASVIAAKAAEDSQHYAEALDVVEAIEDHVRPWSAAPDPSWSNVRNEVARMAERLRGRMSHKQGEDDSPG